MFLRDDDTEARQVEKLTRISTVLAERIDRLEASRGSAWSMFQAAVALEQEVMARTRDLHLGGAGPGARDEVAGELVPGVAGATGVPGVLGIVAGGS